MIVLWRFCGVGVGVDAALSKCELIRRCRLFRPREYLGGELGVCPPGAGQEELVGVEGDGMLNEDELETLLPSRSDMGGPPDGEVEAMDGPGGDCCPPRRPRITVPANQAGYGSSRYATYLNVPASMLSSPRSCCQLKVAAQLAHQSARVW